MSLLGKLLAILNVLAAVAFVAVAGLDWGQRERWAYAVYRHDLLVEGLPIDDKETDANGAPRVDKLSEPTLRAVFQSAGGPPVATQVKEVERVHGLVNAKVQDANVEGTPGQKLARFLHALARTYRDREDFAQQMADAQPNPAAEAELVKKLDEHFAGVTGKQSVEERKSNAARLLFCLGEALQDDRTADPLASENYKRFVVVCGLNEAARAIDDQARLLGQMTQQAIVAHDAERAQFVENHNQGVYQLQNLADALDTQDRRLKSRKAEADRQQTIVDERRAQIEDLTKQLDTLRKETGKNLDRQAELERAVMDKLIELRDTARKNQELERQVRQLEGLPAGR